MKYIGLKKIHGHRVHAFKVSFNVKAWIEKVQTQRPGFGEDTYTADSAHSIVCDAALIHSTKNKYSQKVMATSATHQANHWGFPNPSVIRITAMHQELWNAILKRTEQTGALPPRR